jgi:Tol biopolymer transport system component
LVSRQLHFLILICFLTACANTPALPTITATNYVAIQTTGLQQPTTTPTTRPTITYTPLPILTVPPTPEPRLVWAENISPIWLENLGGHWSPTANELISIHWLDRETGKIYIAEAPDFKQRLINPDDFSFIEPAYLWSPDGQKIFFGGPTKGNENLDVGEEQDLWIMDRDGQNPRRVVPEGSYERSFEFLGWMDHRRVAISGYAGGGHQDISIVDTLSGDNLASAVVYGTAFEPNRDYVPAIFIGPPWSDLLVISPIRQSRPYKLIIGGEYTRRFPKEKLKNINEQSNFLFKNWLPGTNDMLALWFTYKDLYEDATILSSRLLLWNVDNDAITPLAPGVVDGRFSPDGRWLAFVTLGITDWDQIIPSELSLNPIQSDSQTYLYLFDWKKRRVTLSFPVISSKNSYTVYPEYESVLAFSPDSRYLAFLTPGQLKLDERGLPIRIVQDTNSDIFLNILDLQEKHLVISLESERSAPEWSPKSDWLVYQDNFGNWQIFNLHQGESLPITESGGELLYHPKWSFEGHYLSFFALREYPFVDTFVLTAP